MQKLFSLASNSIIRPVAYGRAIAEPGKAVAGPESPAGLPAGLQFREAGWASGERAADRLHRAG